MPSAVEFPSQGQRVRADLYLPEGDGPHPAVVMAGGWCYVKELIQPSYAKYFVDAGFAVLIFDYRCLGDSEGEPRQNLDPSWQIEDYKNAISFLETQDAIDADRIGIWGISYSGGHVLCVGATDPRVRCIVSNIPVVDGLYTMKRAHGGVGFRKLQQVIVEDRRKRFVTGEYGTMTMSADPVDEFAVWPYPEVRPVFMKIKADSAPNHEHWNTIASAEMLLGYDVSPYAERLINTPTLMIVAEDDDVTMWEREIPVFNLIPTTKKKLVVIPSTSHMTLYSNLDRLAIAAIHARDWFVEYLLEPSI